MLSKEVARSFQRMKLAGPATFETPGRFAFVSQITAMRSASRYGKRSRKTALTTVKMALFTPIPSARVRTATKVKPGDFRSCRKAKRKSLMIWSQVASPSFGAESDNGIDARGAAGGEPGGESAIGARRGAGGDQGRATASAGNNGRAAEPDQEICRGNFRPLMLHYPRR